MSTRLEVGSHRTTLATRPVAKALRSELEAAVLEGKSVVIDFDGVLGASSSSIDELVGVLGEWAAQTGASVRVDNPSDEVRRGIEAAVERRRVTDYVVLGVPA